MRRAFSLLESVLALIVFGVVILVVSQAFLQISKDLRFYKEGERVRQTLNLASAYLQRALQYGLITQIDLESIEWLEIDRDDFFSPSYAPRVRECGTNQIKWAKNHSMFANFSPDLRLLFVIQKRGNVLTLNQNIECGALIPLSGKRRLQFVKSQLLVDQKVLVTGIDQFYFEERHGLYSLKLCTASLCQTSVFPKSEIFYAF